MKRYCTISLLVISALAYLLLAGTPACAQSYRVTDLGPVGTVATAINNAGQVTGFTPAGTPYLVPHAFLWTPSEPNGPVGSLKDLGGLPGNQVVSSHGTALTEAGQVVGDSNTVVGPFVNFLNTGLGPFHVVSFKNGAIADLGTLPGFLAATATGVNASGQIAGTAAGTGGLTHAFLLSGGKMTDLGTLPGGTFSLAFGINDSGAIVGEADNTAGKVVPFLYSNGALHDMSGPGELPGIPQAINAAGQVAGKIWVPVPIPGYPPGFFTFRPHGFLWTPAAPGSLTGTFQDFGEWTSATGVGSSGIVVGSAGQGTDTHAFVSRSGAVVDLNGFIPGDSGVTLQQAVSINDAGQIVANGVIGRDAHAFLLTPIAGGTIPSIPGRVIATPGNARVTLTWGVSAQATGYNVKRGTRNTGPFTTIAHATTTQFVDTTAHNGVQYYYAVSAVNSVGESPDSALTSAFPLPNPTNLTAKAGPGKVTLTWRQPAGIRVIANIIYRSTAGGAPTAIAALQPAKTRFTDQGVIPNQTYTYQVTAVAGNFGSRETPPSDPTSVTPR